jgi:cytochrome bd-type quinol oxidase subunit 2
MMTALHALQAPVAVVFAWWLGTLVRKHRLGKWQAYAAALAPGVLIALAAALFYPGVLPRNEQPWQGLLIWATWSALGLLNGWKWRRRPRSMTTLGLSDNGR